MTWTRRSSGADRSYQGRNTAQHWYRDNQVYFLTARCRGRFPAFAGHEAKHIFWEAFDRAAVEHCFTPWVTSLLDNHYHTIGYLKRGDDLAPMLKAIHGSVSRKVNQLLESHYKAGGLEVPLPRALNAQGRLLPFWGDSKHKTYFDGCLRDEKQATLTYRYVLTQCRRHNVCDDWRTYPHTHVNITLERALPRATQLRAFLYDVPYKRYQRKGRGT